MKRRALPLLLLATMGLAALAADARAAPNLDPFRSARGNPLDPVRRLAQAPAPTPPPSPPAPQVCKRDEQCPAGTICDNGACRPIERALNILLFRKEGPVTAFLPFYFSRRGTPGYRVVAPFYWHFWDADGKARVVAPFYWRFEDHVQRRYTTVIGPWSHTWQPDAQSWALWPLFYRSTKFGWAAPLLGSFKIASPDEQRSYGLYSFLYFWKRSPTRRLDLFVPFFYSTRSDSSAFTWALPLNFYWRSGQTKNLLAAPLFFGRWDGNSGLWISPLGYRSSAGQASSGAVLWLYWYGRRADGGAHDVIFPLLWSFRSQDSTTTVVPPYLRLRRGSWSFDTFFPLYWASRDATKGSGWKLLAPLFFSRTTEHGRSHLWLTPLGGYRRDDDAGSRALTFLVPPLIYRKDAEREFESYLLLYWRHTDLVGGASTSLIGPLYRRDDPQGSTRVAFPLFWYFRDARDGAVAHTLLPFYFWRRSPRDRTFAGGVFPVWAYWRRFDDGWAGGLAPLAFFGRRADRAHALVFPLLWHFRDDRGSATLAIPAFYRFTERDRGTTGIPPLLWFQGWERADRYYVQIPFFWRFVDGQAGTTTTVVPPAFFRSRRDGWSGGIAPLLFAGGGGPRRHFVLAPLLWHFRDDTRDRTTTVVANYLHRRHGGETTDALFPLLHWRRGARPGGSDETSFTLFPLAHYRRDAGRTLFVSPLAAWGRTADRKVGGVLPYFWYGSKQVAARGVPPLWFDVTTLATGERTRMFGPYFRLDGPDRRTDVLFPLVARYRSATDSGTYVFPTYFRRRTTDGYAVDTLFPLFWRSRWKDGATLVLGPYFQRKTAESRTFGLAPLFLHSAGDKGSLTLTPISYRRVNAQEGTSRTFVLPLFYGSSWPEGSRSVLFPLWWAGREKDRSQHRVLFPLYWHFGNRTEDWAFNLAGPFLWSHVGTTRTRGLMPIAWYSRDDQKRWGSNALLPLFYEQHGPSHRMVLTLPFGYRSSPDRGWFYAANFVWKDSWSSRFWTLFPLWFSHHDKVSDTRTRVVPPLLHFGRTGPDRSLQGWLLLFWRHRDITSSTTLALPLFWDLHSFHERRVTMLLPLFLRYKNEVSQTSYTFAPLFYRRNAPTDGTTVLFPLLWDFRGTDRRTTIVFPFYAGFKRETWHGRYIFPNIWYRTGRGAAEGTSRLFVFPLWESAVKRPGDYMWEAVLGLFGYERIGRNRFLKLLFFPIEMDPLPPAAQTAWWGKRPPARNPRQRGVSTQVW